MAYLKKIDSVSKRDRPGNKALSLRFLRNKSFLIPETFVIPARVKDDYVKHPEKTSKKLTQELGKWIHPGIPYAVRSSGALEDHKDFSFAGQFKSYLNILGVKDLMDHVIKVWRSAEDQSKSAYVTKTNRSTRFHHMAVIIQEMIHAEWHGVAFSVNPVTGLNEIIIEAQRGSAADPIEQNNILRWTFAHGTWEGPEEKDQFKKEALEGLAKGMCQLKKIWRGNIDVEWAYDGSRLFYLQCRSVTTQKYPTVYSNHISREFLPGMIKPLVWSVNIPLVNGAWIRLLKEVLGPLDIQPEDLSHSFYYRAYFNMGTMGMLFQKLGLPKDSLESLMGRKDPAVKSRFKPGFRSIRYLPRVFLFLVSLLWLEKRFLKWMQDATSERKQIESLLNQDFDPRDFFKNYSAIYTAAEQAAYYNIIVPLVMHITNKLLDRKVKKGGGSTEQINFSDHIRTLKDYDSQHHLQELNELWSQLSKEEQAQAYSCILSKACLSSEKSQLFIDKYRGLIDQFGHLSESGNDFSYPTWNESPEFVLKLMVLSAKHMQEETTLPGNHKIQSEKVVESRSFKRAGRFRLYREMVSSRYVKDYGLFRNLFLKCGHHFESRGLLERAEDVFCLTLDECKQFLVSNQEGSDELTDKVRRVKNKMKEYKELSLPDIIYGNVAPTLNLKKGTHYQGIPVSPGLFSGKIVVVKGYDDFDKEVEGTILIIPFADVGWTPLLVRASAIVSESGGMLSHTSIVAREMSIPAVVSVDNSCKLSDGLEATVDGTNGLLTLHI